MAKVKLPSNFSYKGSFSVSTGLMYGADGDMNRVGPVKVQEKTIRGTLSSASQAQDVEKAAKLQEANIQRVDSAELPLGVDHLLIDFGIKVAPGVWRPSACSDLAYREKLNTFIQAFSEKGGMRDLAERYVGQLASDDWLWNNKDALGFRVRLTARSRGMETIEIQRDVFADTGDSLEPLIDLVAEVLENRRQVAFIRVEGLVALDERAEVYPSQEFVEVASGKGSKSKTLFSINSDNLRQAAMHSQKLGNALRRIDSWHGVNDRVIAVEPYGVDQEYSAAYRKKGTSFYDYARDLDGLIQSLSKGVEDRHRFFAACLIRGGVFGESNKDKS